MRIIRSCSSIGATQAVRLQWIIDRRASYYKRFHVSSVVPPLRLTNLQQRKWSELCGPLIKAANTRLFMPFVQGLAAELFSDEECDEHVMINKIIQALCAVYQVLYNGGDVLSATEKAELHLYLKKLGKYHHMLRHHSASRGDMSFQIKPKAHYGQHFHEIAVNPRIIQNYRCEGLLGRIVRIWKKTSVAHTRPQCNGRSF